MLKAGEAPAEEDDHEIDPHGHGLVAVLRAGFSGPAEPPELRGREQVLGSRRALVGSEETRLDLNDGLDAAAPGDQVDLDAGDPGVPCPDRPAAGT